MPWLPHYIDEPDAAILLASLNSDPEVAFIVPNGRGRWVARREIESAPDSLYCLWHWPSGPLPMAPAEGWEFGFIADPWAGWTELRVGADDRVPFFGAGAPGIIWWDVRTRSRKPETIGLSSFGWIGNHYRILGFSAHESTEKWWKQLRMLPKRLKAIRIPRSGPLDGPKCEVWAFPSALSKILDGVARGDNPF